MSIWKDWLAAAWILLCFGTFLWAAKDLLLA
jgi:hypothetical protein